MARAERGIEVIENELKRALRAGRHMQFIASKFQIIGIDGMTVWAEGDDLNDLVSDYESKWDHKGEPKAF